ncbi:carboxylesterase type B [Streptomyces umbrinus]|uniref:Carboxylesterase type B n=1 Tax=Streptomyces umbrinus TaxID=67370 RepID=A0ABU0T778_9ACTN|nr:carboxylesterase family protein [Streptomyces umbrinus]MDQ1031667.1 carboxylesterase type B [Streptomyces umbrinus]
MSERSGEYGTVFRTAAGLVRGREADADGVVAVPGIPYAALPFGVRRFVEPQPSRAWAVRRSGP